MATLKERLGANEPVDGCVVKIPSHQMVEVLAASGVSTVMIDLEHGAVGTDALDAMIAVAMALRVDTLVRIGSADRRSIQQALDMGATGVVVPHVESAEIAADVARWAHYGASGRGYSGSTRSAGWGTRSMADVVVSARRTIVVVIQVEDAAALDHLDEIVAVDDIDAVFIGPADLAVGSGAESTRDRGVVQAVARIIAACRSAGRPTAAYAVDDNDVARWRSAGAALVFNGSDQSRLLGGQS